jgi:hypothetical protein
MSGTQVPLPDGTFAFFPEGTSDAQMAAGMQTLLAQMPKPPPGVIIHEPTRSYVTGEQGEPTLSVDTTGMARGTGMTATPGAGPGGPTIGSTYGPPETPDTLPLDVAPKAKPFNLSDYIVGSVGSLAGGGTADPRLPDRNTAAAALALRRDNPVLGTNLLAPPFQGATANFGDELISRSNAAGDAIFRGRPFGEIGETYDVTQEAQRQQLAQARAEHPYLSGALQAGGALLNLATLGGAGIPQGAAATAPLGARMLGGAGMGAGYGAVEGFGSGSGLRDRLQEAGVGAGTGLLVGGAIPALADVAGAGARKVLDLFSVSPRLRELGVGRQAGDLVDRALRNDDAYTGVGRQNIEAAGAPGMLVDAGGSAQGLLDAVQQGGGGGSRLASEAIKERGKTAATTLTDALDAALGKPQGVEQMVGGIRTGSAAARGTAYDAAYAAPIDYSQPAARELEDFIRTRVPQSAINAANTLMREEGEPLSRQIRATIDAEGNAVYDRPPDVRQIDFITRGLRHLARTGEDASPFGTPTDVSAVRQANASRIRGMTRELVPEYGVALDTASDAFSRADAVNLGNQILNPSMTRAQAREALTNHQASAAEMQNVRDGVRAYIDEAMANVRNIATNPDQDVQETARILGQLNSRATRDKLDMVIPDPLQRPQLQSQLDESTRAIQLRAQMAANSKTFGRQVQREGVQAVSDTAAETARRIEPYNFLKRGGQLFTGGRPQDVLGRQDVLNQQIAELLTTARGQTAQDQLGLLARAYTAAPQNVARAQSFGQGAGLLAGVPAYGYGQRLVEGLARNFGLLGGGP